VGPTAGLDRCEKSHHHRDSIPGPSASYEIMRKNVVRFKQLIDGNIILRTRIICWITRATTHTHTQTQNMYYLLPFHGNNVYANAPQWYVIPVFLPRDHSAKRDMQIVYQTSVSEVVLLL
jgi:hypothetical protein